MRNKEADNLTDEKLEKRILDASSIIEQTHLNDFASTDYFIDNVKKKIKKKNDLTNRDKVYQVMVKLFDCITDKTEFLKRFNEGVSEFVMLKNIPHNDNARMRLLVEIIYVVYA